MKKSLSLVLALVFVLGIAGTAFAANPFVDVPAKHWSYAAVSQLVKAGIVDGYDDNTFRGDKSMTRYEMAQVVAKAMAKSDKADAANKALIEKLAAEYSAELDNLGVRVGKLEKNQANLKFNGTFEVRYNNNQADNRALVASDALGSNSQYRLRLEGKAAIDEDTSFGMRFASKAENASNFKNATFLSFGDDSTNAQLDRYFVTRKTGVFNTTLGRQAWVIDPLSVAVDSGAFSFDAVKTAWTMGQFNMTAQYGRVSKMGNDLATSDLKTFKGYFNTSVSNADVIALANLDTYGLTVASKADKLAYTVGYDVLKGGQSKSGPRDTIGKLWFVNTAYSFDNKFTFAGQYMKNTEADTDGSNWYLQGIYGTRNLAKTGDQNFTLSYYKVGAESLIPQFTTLDKPGNSTMFNDNYKAWQYDYNYAFSKTFSAQLRYLKLTDTDNAAQNWNYTRLLFTSKF